MPSDASFTGGALTSMELERLREIARLFISAFRTRGIKCEPDLLNERVLVMKLDRINTFPLLARSVLAIDEAGLESWIQAVADGVASELAAK